VSYPNNTTAILTVNFIRFSKTNTSFDSASPFRPLNLKVVPLLNATRNHAQIKGRWAIALAVLNLRDKL
jgi:hypothetical protein